MNRILLFGLLFSTITGFAQDSIKVRNRLTETIKESFFVKKTDKLTKTGIYLAIYKHNKPLAIGKYLNNKRNGIWHFYDETGTIIENFNYDSNTLLYEKPDDSISQLQIRYSFDDSLKYSDYVTKPIKPGGRCFGYLPYLRLYKLSDDFANDDLSLFTAILEILVSPGGRLADFKVHIKSADFERITSFNTELIDVEDRLFIPATINHQPVVSTIFVKCRITSDGELDID